MEGVEFAGIIFFIGALVFLSHFFVGIFSKTQIPDILWLMLIGILLGPLLGVIRPDHFGELGKILAKITLVVILFEAGLEIRLDLLKRYLGSALFLTISSYLVCFFILWFFLSSLGSFGSLGAIFPAAILAGPAPSVVIPILKHMKLQDSTRTILSIEATLGEALCILVSLAILQRVTSLELAQIGLGYFFFKLSVSFVLAIFLGFFAGYIWSLLLTRVRKLHNSLFTTPAFVFIVFGLAEILTISGPIAILVFGITMGNIRYITNRFFKNLEVGNVVSHTKTEKNFFSEIVFILKIFFFIYLGISIDFSQINAFIVGGMVVVLILVARWSTAVTLRPVLRWTVSDARQVMSMFPRGLAAAILASVAMIQGIEGSEEVASIVNYTVFLSIILTSVMIFWTSRHGQMMESTRDEETVTEASKK